MLHDGDLPRFSQNNRNSGTRIARLGTQPCILVHPSKSRRKHPDFTGTPGGRRRRGGAGLSLYPAVSLSMVTGGAPGGNRFFPAPPSSCDVGWGFVGQKGRQGKYESRCNRSRPGPRPPSPPCLGFRGGKGAGGFTLRSHGTADIRRPDGGPHSFLVRIRPGRPNSLVLS